MSNLQEPEESPLDRKRRLDADLAELTLRKRSGELFAVADVRACLTSVVEALRDLGEDAQRRYGADAFNMVDECRNRIIAAQDALERQNADRLQTSG